MPIYEYQCEKCKKHHEVAQRITDAPLTRCPECKGKLKKLLSLSGFQLKGGGWYKDGYSSPSTESAKESPKPAETVSSADTASTPKPEKKESSKPAKPSKKKSSKGKA